MRIYGLLSLVVLTPLMAVAGDTKVRDDFTPFAPGEYCGEAVSVDGVLAAGAEASTGDLYYYDFGKTSASYTGISDVYSPAIKGLQIAFMQPGCITYPCPYPQPFHLYVYDIGKAEVISTGVSTAARRWNRMTGHYFDGKRIAYKDAGDGHIKIYSLEDKTVLDTGWTGTPDPTLDGDFVTFEYEYGDVYTGWKRDIVLYQISTQQAIVIDSGTSPVIAGNVVVYTQGTWGGPLTYYLIDSQQTVNTPFEAYTWSTDGERIVFEVRGEPIRVLDVKTGKAESTGIYGCSGGDSCWLDISGKYISYERWEGGTSIQGGTGWIEIYPPAELNNDDIEHCAAGWFKY